MHIFSLAHAHTHAHAPHTHTTVNRKQQFLYSLFKNLGGKLVSCKGHCRQGNDYEGGEAKIFRTKSVGSCNDPAAFSLCTLPELSCSTKDSSLQEVSCPGAGWEKWHCLKYFFFGNKRTLCCTLEGWTLIGIYVTCCFASSPGAPSLLPEPLRPVFGPVLARRGPFLQHRGPQDIRPGHCLLQPANHRTGKRIVLHLGALGPIISSVVTRVGELTWGSTYGMLGRNLLEEAGGNLAHLSLQIIGNQG